MNDVPLYSVVNWTLTLAGMGRKFGESSRSELLRKDCTVVARRVGEGPGWD